MTYGERIREFQNIYLSTGKPINASLLIPDVYKDSYFEEIKPKQRFYECRAYTGRTTASASDVYDKLEKLATEKVSKMPIFTYKKRKEKFIEENKVKVEEEIKQKLEAEQREFEENECKIKKRKR